MSAPRKISQTGSSVKLGWSPLPGFEFELQSREGASNFEPTTCRGASASTRPECWKTVTKTMSTTFPVKGLLVGKVYRFRLRAISTTCGGGDWSANLVINMSVKPCTMENVTMKRVQGDNKLDCAVLISWSKKCADGSASFNGGSTIRNFDL